MTNLINLFDEDYFLKQIKVIPLSATQKESMLEWIIVVLNN